MKTLKLFSLFMLLSLLSMGMGFPDIISERDIIELKKNRKQKEMIKTQAMGCSGERRVVVQHKHTAKQSSAKRMNTSTCQEQVSQPTNESSFISKIAAALNNMISKLYHITESLLLTQQEQRDDSPQSNYEVNHLFQESAYVYFIGILLFLF